MSRYILFLAESSDQGDWENRQLAHTQALTDILHEYFDSSDRPLRRIARLQS